MANKPGKVAATGAAAVVAVAGGAVAHSAGAFRSAADDSVRAATRVHKPPELPDIRVPPQPEIPVVASPTDDVLRQTETDDYTLDIVCFAYGNFYDSDTGSFVLPSSSEFAGSVIETLATSGTASYYREKAYALRDELSDPAVDAATIAEEVVC